MAIEMRSLGEQPDEVEAPVEEPAAPTEEVEAAPESVSDLETVSDFVAYVMSMPIDDLLIWGFVAGAALIWFRK